MPIRTEGWFVHAAAPGETGPSRLTREHYEIEELAAGEVLVEPLYASWEANLQHAIARDPIDTCAARGLSRAVIGNAGTGRIVAVGDGVAELREGQACMMHGIERDPFGYPVRMMGFDSRMPGVLTTRLKLRQEDVVPVPENSRHSLAQWAAFNCRYVTAWSNWNLALGVLRLQLGEEELQRLNVWGWGGGTAFAEVQLATLFGHRGVVLCSRSDRHELARRAGLESVDRGTFGDLCHDPARFREDRDAERRYAVAEEAFLETVRERTDGAGVHVFVDPIGAPVFRATLRALSRGGVVTTFGWRAGMRLEHNRAVQCIARQQFVHTHLARRSEFLAAVAFGEERGWMPEVDERVYSFDDVPELAARYAAGDFRMFPVCRVNPE